MRSREDSVLDGGTEGHAECIATGEQASRKDELRTQAARAFDVAVTLEDAKVARADRLRFWGSVRAKVEEEVCQRLEGEALEAMDIGDLVKLLTLASDQERRDAVVTPNAQELEAHLPITIMMAGPEQRGGLRDLDALEPRECWRDLAVVKALASGSEDEIASALAARSALMK